MPGYLVKALLARCKEEMEAATASIKEWEEYRSEGFPRTWLFHPCVHLVWDEGRFGECRRVHFSFPGTHKFDQERALGRLYIWKNSRSTALADVMLHRAAGEWADFHLGAECPHTLHLIPGERALGSEVEVRPLASSTV